MECVQDILSHACHCKTTLVRHSFFVSTHLVSLLRLIVLCKEIARPFWTTFVLWWVLYTRILTKHLHYGKFCAQWVPHQLTKEKTQTESLLHTDTTRNRLWTILICGPSFKVKTPWNAVQKSYRKTVLHRS